MRDIRQTPHFAKYLATIGWTVEKKNGVNYFIRKIPLIGSFLKVQRPERLSNKDIKFLSYMVKKYRVFQIVVEPKDKNQEEGIRNYGFRKSKSPYLPSKTLHLDMTKSKNTLFNGLKKDARYALRRSLQLSDYSLQQEKDIQKFRDVWKRSVLMSRYVLSLNNLEALKKSFRKNCVFLTCKNKGKQIVAGAIFLSNGKMAYYWQAFTNEEGRKNYAQYKIVWEGILWAKKTGAKIFDFEGIYDERFPNKSWLGFTHFKNSFGGKEVEYPGAFVKNRLPL